MSDDDEVGGAAEELTPKQTAVMVQLLAGAGAEQAAKTVGVGERTVWTWLSTPLFKNELRSRQRQALEGVTRKLQASSSKAVEALERVLGDPMAPHAAVVSAAKAVLDMAYRGVELGDLAERLEELEAAAEQAGRPGGSRH
jgi:transposase